MFLPDIAQQSLVLANNMSQESLLKLGDLAGLQFIKIPSHTSINNGHLFFNSHGSWKQKNVKWIAQINKCHVNKVRETYLFLQLLTCLLHITYSHILYEKLHNNTLSHFSPQGNFSLYLQALKCYLWAYSISTVYYLAVFILLEI